LASGIARISTSACRRRLPAVNDHALSGVTKTTARAIGAIREFPATGY
jgi:hypothetical protein